MRIFLAYIFIIIFSFQVLPVRELGKIFSKGQLTEEVHNDNDTFDDCAFKIKKGSDLFHFTHTEYTVRDKHFTVQILAKIQATERIPQHHVPEVPTPPPNYCI